jgi:membrane-associated phospholipid phosphatase
MPDPFLIFGPPGIPIRAVARKFLISLFASISLIPALTFADGPTWAKFASTTGSIAYLAVGTLLPLERDGSFGRAHTLRTMDSLFVSVALSEGLKKVTREKRPDSNAHDSFPSGHATAAFAVATMESEFHPNEAPLWYAGAAAIGDSRVVLHRHHWGDVIAGAALGYGTSRFELSRSRGILIQPLMNEDGTVGLMMSGRF